MVTKKRKEKKLWMTAIYIYLKIFRQVVFFYRSRSLYKLINHMYIFITYYSKNLFIDEKKMDQKMAQGKKRRKTTRETVQKNVQIRKAYEIAQ